MRFGQLDNTPSPRIVIVFEGAIGRVPEEREKDYAKAVARGRWFEAISCFDLSDIMLRKLLDISWRLNLNVNVVTWLGEEAAIAIEFLLERENIPVRGCFASTPLRLARDLPYNPDIVAVYDPDPAHVFTYGSKGILLEDPNQIGRIYG